MALNIKDATTDELARELAAEAGESITEAIRIAISERLTRLRRRRLASTHTVELHRFIERGRQRATLDGRTAEKILGYDESGLP